MFGSNAEKKVKIDENSTSSSIIGKGTSVEGNVDSSGNISVEGEVKGNVTSKSKVVLGPSSYIEGKVWAINAIIAGEIQGSVEVGELLTLKPTAVIHGDIITNKLVVESGATFNGSCRMGISVNNLDLEDEPQEETIESGFLTEDEDSYLDPESEYRDSEESEYGTYEEPGEEPRSL